MEEKKVSRKEAIKISRNTLEKAEKERMSEENGQDSIKQFLDSAEEIAGIFKARGNLEISFAILNVIEMIRH